MAYIMSEALEEKFRSDLEIIRSQKVEEIISRIEDRFSDIYQM